jgi:hypothetical protein
MKIYTWDEMKKRSKLSAAEIARIEREALAELRPTQIDLGPMDAALVVRADGSWEGFLPDQDPDAEVPPQSEFISACMLALADPETKRLLLERMQAAVDAGRDEPEE